MKQVYINQFSNPVIQTGMRIFKTIVEKKTFLFGFFYMYEST
jgi:hypothetical protein